MMIDGHTHLEYGPLDKEYVRQFVEKAAERGITTLHILDHTHRFSDFRPIYEPLMAIEEQDKWLHGPLKFQNSLDDYVKLINECRQEEWPIEVKFGLEICHTPEGKEHIKKVLDEYGHNFDFLVGAIHSIDTRLYDMGFSDKILWNVFDYDAIYTRYYELVEDLICSDLYTQLAHPDTIKMFNHYPSYDLTPTYHRIAELLKQHNMKAENNTGCHYRYNHKDIGLSDELLQIFKEHGVTMITASDAHHPEDVGTDIKDVWDTTMKER